MSGHAPLPRSEHNLEEAKLFSCGESGRNHRSPFFSAGHPGLVHDAWQTKPFKIQQIVTAMQISETNVEVIDVLLCRELACTEVLVLVEALGPVRAAHLATKF